MQKLSFSLFFLFFFFIVPSAFAVDLVNDDLGLRFRVKTPIIELINQEPNHLYQESIVGKGSPKTTGHSIGISFKGVGIGYTFLKTNMEWERRKEGITSTDQEQLTTQYLDGYYTFGTTITFTVGRGRFYQGGALYQFGEEFYNSRTLISDKENGKAYFMDIGFAYRNFDFLFGYRYMKMTFQYITPPGQTLHIYNGMERTSAQFNLGLGLVF